MYSTGYEADMKRYYHSLPEKGRRRYAALEALRLGHGGITYIANLFECSRTTIYAGINEIKNNSFPPLERVRREGGGRKPIDVVMPDLEQLILEILEESTAGSPMHELKWTNLTPQEISEFLALEGIIVSNTTIRKTIKKLGFKRRKAKKCKTYKDVKDRDAQFIKINNLKKEYFANNEPVISIDAKKKEQLGNFYRDGILYTKETIETLDHDFSSYGDGPILQYGIHDLGKNVCFMYLNRSKDTSEFVCDNLRSWWYENGQYEYPNAKRMLVLADGGGSNSSRYFIFKHELQKLADEIGIEIRMAHYPPYTSKYNPIEHRVFCHVTRACQGVVFSSIELVKELIETTKTSKGLKVFSRINNKVYETGKKATEEFIANMPIVFDNFLGRWNYCAVPQ